MKWFFKKEILLNEKAIIGFIILLVMLYVELTIMGIITPGNMILHSILVILLSIINITLYYFFVRPVNLVKFNIIQVIIILPIVILLTVINHTFIHHDLKIIQLILLPLFIFISIIISSIIYKLVLNKESK